MQRVLYANGKERVSSITFLIVINITDGLSVVERKGPAYGDKNSNGSQPGCQSLLWLHSGNWFQSIWFNTMLATKIVFPSVFKGIGHAVSHGVIKPNMGPIRMVVTRLFMRSVMGSVVMSRVRSRAPSAVKTKSPKNAPPENSPKAASSSPVFPPLTRQRREPDSRSRESAKWQIRKLKREDLN